MLRPHAPTSEIVDAVVGTDGANSSWFAQIVRVITAASCSIDAGAICAQLATGGLGI